MGANRAGVNLRRKQKRHRKNLEKYMAAVDKREAAKAPAKKRAKSAG